MKKPIPTAEPTQVGAADSTHAFLELIRGTLRREAEEMLAEEVTALCGRSHYPQLAALYPERREMEGVFDELKTYLRGGQQVVLRSKTPDLVEQEIYGLLLANRAVRS